MNTVDQIKGILRDTLHIGARADQLTEASHLLGALPEFDSIAVITVITTIEEEFDLRITDDEINTDVFETLGSLVAFVDAKLTH
jgi:acyl carrier protein